MAGLHLDVVLLGRSLGLCQGMDLVKVHAGIFLNGFHHGHTGKGLSQIHFNAVINDLCGSQDLLGHKAVQVLSQVHHAVVVGVCLVKLH